MRYLLKLSIGFIFFVFGILFSWWISTDSTQEFLILTFEFTSYDCKNELNKQCLVTPEENCICDVKLPTCTCKAGPNALDSSTFITILILVPLAYSVIFLLFLISRYHVKSILTDIIIEIPRKKIEKVIELNENDNKLIVYFVVLASIITILSGLFMLNFPTEVMINEISDLIDTVDITGLVSSTVKSQVDDKNQEASEALIFNVGIGSWIVLGIGPFWVLLLRKIRKFKKQSGENKHTGSKSLLFYLYAISFLLIINHHVNNILVFEIYGRPTLEPEENLAFIVGISIIISLIIFGIDKFIIRRFES